jgi:tetratricopeptide (TPR) repeat protein
MQKIVFFILCAMIVVQGGYLTKQFLLLQSMRPGKAGEPRSVRVAVDVKKDASTYEEKVHALLSKVYQKPLDLAIQEYKERVAKNDKDADAHYHLGTIYAHLPAQKTLAIYHLQKALELKPDHPAKKSIENQIRLCRKK